MRASPIALAVALAASALCGAALAQTTGGSVQMYQGPPGPPGATQDLSAYSTTAASNSAIAAAIAMIPTNDLGTFTVAQLTNGATIPCNSGNAKKTAWASDLFGASLGDRVVCDGVNWKPVRPLAVSVDVTSSNLSLVTLVNAPTHILTGTIGTGVTRTVSISTTNAYAGAKFCTTRKASGLGTLTVSGLLGGLTTALGINSWACFEYDGSAWQQTQSGGLL